MAGLDGNVDEINDVFFFFRNIYVLITVQGKLSALSEIFVQLIQMKKYRCTTNLCLSLIQIRGNNAIVIHSLSVGFK